MDFLKLIQNIKENKFDIVYLDPPYKTNFIIQALSELVNYKKLTKDSLIVLETDEEKRIIEQIENEGNFEITDKRKYGRAILIFLKIVKGRYF